MNIFNIMQAISQIKQNPMQILGQRFNVPQGMNNPSDIIQHLLDTGQVSQTQVNQAMNMRNNPMFKQFMR